MNLKEQYEAKQKELAEIHANIESDPTMSEKAKAIMAEMDDLKSRIEIAKEAESKLKNIGNATVEEKEEETGLKAVDFAGLKSNPGSRSVNLKLATDPETSTTQYTYDKNVVSLVNALKVRDLFGKEQISTNALTYYVLNTLEGTISTVAEGAKKGQIHIPYTPKTAALAKIAAYFKETDEILADNAFLEAAIRNRGIYEFNKAVESYLLTTLLATSGVQTGGASVTFDTILAAKQDITADTGYVPDAMIINPSDLATLLQSKDANNQYLLGGPAYGQYGNGVYNSNPKIWGLEVVESAAMTAGQVLVGAYKAGAAVVTKAGEGFRLEVSNSNEDDFIYNMVTVRLEERMLEAVRVPAAFEIVGTAS